MKNDNFKREPQTAEEAYQQIMVDIEDDENEDDDEDDDEIISNSVIAKPEIPVNTEARKTKMSLKEKLIVTMGGFGYVLFYLIIGVITFAPLMYLNFPWWVDILIIFIVMFTKTIGGLVLTVGWIWSFINMINSPFNFKTVFYIIAVILYIILWLAPFVTSIIYARKNNR
ncbi:MAG: hypothetical protein WC374_06620 [Phycisphaerae bacterium]|jgi:hypothetical protein